MEIERKWLVGGWPQADYPVLFEEKMRQGYVSVEPTVRIREEERAGSVQYILCFKSRGTLAREEIEFPIPEEKFREIEEKIIGLPLIRKIRRTYLLPDGLHLEVNIVDQGEPGEFMYAEIEYPDEAAAKSWTPPDPDLARYLGSEVTMIPGSSMGAYWIRTRLQGKQS